MVMLKRRYNFIAGFFCVCLLCFWVVGCGNKSDSTANKQTKEISRPMPVAEPPPKGAVAKEKKEPPQPEKTITVAVPEADKPQQAPAESKQVLEPSAQETAIPAGQPETVPEGTAPISAEKQAEIDAITREAGLVEGGADANKAPRSEAAPEAGQDTAMLPPNENVETDKDAPVIDIGLKEESEDGETDDLMGSEEVMDAGEEADSGAFDPFSPLFQKSKGGVTVTESPGQQRGVLTPLERIDIGQLSLAGVIMAETGNRAVVTDASGKGYVITKGTYVGLSSGIVERIESDRILIIETIIETLGSQKTEKKIEKVLKLPKPAGD